MKMPVVPPNREFREGAPPRAMTRPYLRTADCAAVLGVSAQYVRDEIRAGRLKGEIIARDVAPGRTKAYAAIRVYPGDFAVYVARYWPRIQWPCSTGHTSAESAESV